MDFLLIFLDDYVWPSVLLFPCLSGMTETVDGPRSGVEGGGRTKGVGVHLPFPRLPIEVFLISCALVSLPMVIAP